MAHQRWHPAITGMAAPIAAGVALRQHRLYAYLDKIPLGQGQPDRVGRDSW